MTLEQYNKAKEVEAELLSIKQELPKLAERVVRYNDYLKLMDGRTPAPTYAGKPVKKAELKLNVDPIKTDLADNFDMIEENKEDFVKFLKKCQANYQKQIESLMKRQEELEVEFARI